MTAPRAAGLGVLALLPLAWAAAQPPPAADLILTGRLHHLRVGAVREWSDFPERAEGPALVLPFQSTANARERTLRLRHRDVKQAWRVGVNGRELARLPADEADTLTYWPIPPGALRDGANELRIEGQGTAPDDVLIGEAAVLDRPRADVLSEATVDVAVTESPGGAAIPSRITVTDAHGTLVSLGNTSDGTHAVRPGVVYTRDGTARLKVPAGRYVIHAGRGFEYGVDRVAVDVARGAVVTRRLAIRREVDTAGWAAMDTHVHTATFARHGDATIDERMLTLAGEGIELPVSTEHNQRVPFDERARAAGVASRFTPLLGSEVTTPALGHFNVFPLPGDGSIDQRAPDWTALRRAIDAAGDRPIAVLNHGRDVHGGFRPLDPARHVGIAGESLDGWTLPADAMEIVNSGAVLSDGLGLPRDWMGLLNRGVRLTPVGSSDSHDVARYIVGQGRTYVRCDDRDPARLDPVAVIDSVRRGRVMVSYGLLTSIDVAASGPGDLVRHAGGDLVVRVRVQGPSWTRAARVALYANGVPIREAAIQDEAKAGLKHEVSWRLPAPGHDVHLVAMAAGPGVTAAYWATAKPYQPTSPDFTPYVLGVSGAIFVDADGSGTWESARAYAERALAGDPIGRALAERLAGHDAAVGIQVASLLRARDPAGVEARVRSLLDEVAGPVASGLNAYLRALPAR